jgi:hypothetical protein
MDRVSHYVLSRRQQYFLLAVEATWLAQGKHRRILDAASLARTAFVDAGRVGRLHGRQLKDLGPYIAARREISGAEFAVAVFAVSFASAERKDVSLLTHRASNLHETLRQFTGVKAEYQPQNVRPGSTILVNGKH